MVYGCAIYFNTQDIYKVRAYMWYKAILSTSIRTIYTRYMHIGGIRLYYLYKVHAKRWYKVILSTSLRKIYTRYMHIGGIRLYHLLQYARYRQGTCI